MFSLGSTQLLKDEAVWLFSNALGGPFFLTKKKASYHNKRTPGDKFYVNNSTEVIATNPTRLIPRILKY
jgi:hypothetical protein